MTLQVPHLLLPKVHKGGVQYCAGKAEPLLGVDGLGELAAFTPRVQVKGHGERVGQVPHVQCVAVGDDPKQLPLSRKTLEGGLAEEPRTRPSLRAYATHPLVQVKERAEGVLVAHISAHVGLLLGSGGTATHSPAAE